MVNFNQVLVDLDGESIKDRVFSDGKMVSETIATLGRCAANALLAMTDADKNISGEVKVRRYELAMRVIRGENVILKVEDVAEVKSAIGKHYAPLIVGQAWKMLDPGE